MARGQTVHIDWSSDKGSVDSIRSQEIIWNDLRHASIAQAQMLKQRSMSRQQKTSKCRGCGKESNDHKCKYCGGIR